jgi:hypothetical protein
MSRINSRTVELIKATWPVLAAGYVIQLINGAVVMASTWSVTRVLPEIDFDFASGFDPDRLLRLISAYLGTIGLAFIWISVGLTVSWLIIIFLNGGVLGVFRSWARDGNGFELDDFIRSGFAYLGPLLGLNMLLLALFIAVGLAVAALSLALSFAAGALVMNAGSALASLLLMLLLGIIALLPLVAGFFLFLASGVASARLVWDDLPVLTSLRLFLDGLKSHFWLHAGVGVVLCLWGGGAFLLLLLLVLGIRSLGGEAAGVAALSALVQFLVLNCYTLFYLAAMTALMECLRPDGSASGR